MQATLLNHYSIFFSLLATILSGCNSAQKNNPEHSESKISKEEKISIKDSVVIETIKEYSIHTSTDSIRVMMIPCANGYEYTMHGYQLNPIIKRELKNITSIIVQPFPLKKLQGVSYQGIFDKKYCIPIINKVDVPFLIMTQFTGNPFVVDTTKKKWGYQTKILNTKTMDQINSIGANNLQYYSEIEKHIKENITRLQSDIKKIK